MSECNQNRIANLEDWKPINFWKYNLKKYRVSKKIRRLIDKDNGYSFTGLVKRLGVSRQYIYNVMLMNIKPNDEFIKKLEGLGENLNIRKKGKNENKIAKGRKPKKSKVSRI